MPAKSSTPITGIVRGMLAVTAFALLGKVAGAVKEMAVAWRFGVGAPVDAYLLVQNLVNWPVAIWFSVLTVVLIPLANRIAIETPDELPRFRRELLAATLTGGVLLAIGGSLGLPRLLASSFMGLPGTTRDIALHMSPVLAWLALPGLLVGLYSTWLMAAGRHANTLFEGIPALVILGGVLLVEGAQVLAWATLAGTVLQFGALAGALHYRTRHGRPLFNFTSPSWGPFWRGFGIMALGQALMGVTVLVEQFFAARMGEGSISSVGYANRVLALVLGVLATAATRATLPVFARIRAAGNLNLRRFATRWAAWLGFAGVAILVIGWLLAPLGIRLLFERGTFSRHDSETVTHLLQLGLLQVPFYLASLVLVSLHSSEGRYRLLLLSGVLGLAVKVGVSYALIPVLGIGALVASSTAVYAANVALLLAVRR